MLTKVDGLVDASGHKLPDAPYPEFKIPNIRIVGPRLLILPPVRRELITQVGIIIPEKAQEVTRRGIVLLAGDGVTLPSGETRPPCVEPGYQVIYSQYAGTELEMDGLTMLIIQESDVRAVLTYLGKAFTLDPLPTDRPQGEPS